MKKRCNRISNIFAMIILALITELIVANLSIGYGLMYSVTNTSVERDFWGLEAILYPIRIHAQRLIFFSGPIAVLVITTVSCTGKEEPHPQYWALLKVVMSYIVPFVLCIPEYFVSVRYNFGNPSYYFYPYILFGFVPACLCVVVSLPVVFFVKIIRKKGKLAMEAQRESSQGENSKPLAVDCARGYNEPIWNKEVISMNRVMEAMETRRSIRSYRPDAVPQDAIERICRAGTYAPTGMGQQSPIILAVTKKELRDKLSEMNRKVMGIDADPFYGAPAVLVVLVPVDCPTGVFDGSLVMGNLLLAAHAEGLGSCWIHRAEQEFASEEGKAILKELGIEGDYVGIGHCIVGYPACDLPEPAPRKENYVYYIR